MEVWTDCYQELGVSMDDSMETIKRRWKELNKEYHLDRNMGLPEEVRRAKEQKLAKINNAYDVLKRKRTTYDRDFQSNKRRSESATTKTKPTAKTQPKAQQPKKAKPQTPPKKETKTSSYWDRVAKEAEEIKRKEAERKREERIRENKKEQQAREKKLHEQWQKQAETAADWKARTRKERAAREREEAEAKRAEAKRQKREQAEAERKAREKKFQEEWDRQAQQDAEQRARTETERLRQEKKPATQKKKQKRKSAKKKSSSKIRPAPPIPESKPKEAFLKHEVRVKSTAILFACSLILLPQLALFLPIASLLNAYVPERYWGPFGAGFFVFGIIGTSVSWWIATGASSALKAALRFLLYAYSMNIGVPLIILIIKYNA